MFDGIDWTAIGAAHQLYADGVIDLDELCIAYSDALGEELCHAFMRFQMAHLEAVLARRRSGAAA